MHFIQLSYLVRGEGVGGRGGDDRVGGLSGPWVIRPFNFRLKSKIETEY